MMTPRSQCPCMHAGCHTEGGCRCRLGGAAARSGSLLTDRTMESAVLVCAPSRLTAVEPVSTGRGPPLLVGEPLGSQLEPCSVIGWGGGQRRHSVTLPSLASVVGCGHARVLSVPNDQAREGFPRLCCGRREQAQSVIDADPIATAVRAVMTTRTEWRGTASDLLGALAEAAGERAAKSKTWPDSPRALAGRLRRAATFLRKIGVEVVFKKESRARTRIIHIMATPPSAVQENIGARPSAPSTSALKSSPANGFTAPPMRTVASDADGREDGRGKGNGTTVRANSLKTSDEFASDDADANIPG